MTLAADPNLDTLAPPRRRTGAGAVPGGAGRLGLMGPVAVVTALALLPLAAVVWIALTPAENIWPHLASTVLPTYVTTTLALMLGVAVTTLVLGIGTAWLVTMFRFPGRGLFDVGMLLPLAMPSYIVAYAAVSMFDYAGPVQSLLRDLFGWESARDYWFPQVRSLWGAVAVMGLTLYPYVYLAARSAFLEQSVCVLEVARTLGLGPWRRFLRVALPLARPSIVVGVALALMECLNDYGTVEHFAVPTLTRGVFDVWMGMGNVSGAAQIALVLLAFVLVLLLAERASRRGRQYHHTTGRRQAIPRSALGPVARWFAFLACALPVALGFVAPVAMLISLSRAGDPSRWLSDIVPLAGASLTVATLTAAAAIAAGLLLAYASRLSPRGPLRWAVRIATLGYAVPGAVLAVGVLIPLAAFDNALDAWMRATFGLSTGLLLTGGVAALVFALTVRFMALSYGTAEAGLTRVTASMDMAARTLGRGPFRVLREVHLPLIRGSLLTGALIVFVDAMKELPATLLLRPFGLETLATHVYVFASLEQIERAAPAALMIVAAGILPVLLLARASGRTREVRRAPGA